MFAGDAVWSGLGGLVIYVPGSLGPILALSIVFSLVGALVVATLEPSDKVLIPDWQDSLPPEARLAPVVGGVSAAD